MMSVATEQAGGLPPTPQGPAKSKRALTKLLVAPPGTGSGYSRSKFGNGWASAPGGCDTRDVVLLRDGRKVKKGSGCRIVSGRWRSYYDGIEETVPSKLDIDHVVPLAEAWRSGAS
jgi:hypothetical protein